ncbi:hypothetical protein [Alteraurantiacibacter buctensis]|uniref:Lysis protein n=1 Tax=Alteraurantiacibacter buctensis TaxID=1503981 RepID=A0A844Z2W6_9SPHN|nr:hypothetical protein [Alteraurantiacibacter buctensis]MXO72857.1 hypothetical protein [Alteraurantiacibacter buctensis]
MTALLAIRAFLGKLPWQAYAVLAAIGIVLIAYSKGYGDARDKYHRQMAELTASVEAAQEQARAAQIAVIEAEQARLDAVTKEADHAHEVTRVVVRDATDRFIADNGVRPNGQCVASGTDSAAADPGAGVSESLPAKAIVDTADVRACADLYAYSIAAREWALGLSVTE